MENAAFIAIGVVLIIVCIYAITNQQKELFNTQQRVTNPSDLKNRQNTSFVDNTPNARLNDNKMPLVYITPNELKIKEGEKLDVEFIKNTFNTSGQLYQNPFSTDTKQMNHKPSYKGDSLYVIGVDAKNSSAKTTSKRSEREKRELVSNGGFIKTQDGKPVTKSMFDGKPDLKLKESFDFVEPFDITYRIQQNVGSYAPTEFLEKRITEINSPLELVVNNPPQNSYKACVCDESECKDYRTDMNNKSQVSNKNTTMVIDLAQAQRYVGSEDLEYIKFIKKGDKCIA